jgi:acyl carrier protein
MARKERLVEFIEAKLAEKRLGLALTDRMSLVQSSLLDSQDLLDLALWIEHEIDPQVDLSQVDVAREWDTVANILDFIAAHRGKGPDGP